MTCAESKRLMFMTKEEMTKQEGKNLRRHLATCAECAALMEETKTALGGIEALRSFDPLPENGDRLTSDILNAVAEVRRMRNKGVAGISARVPGLLLRRAIRIAYGVFVLGAVGMFLVQQLRTAVGVQSLETRMVHQRVDGASVATVYSVPTALVNRLPRSGEVRAYMGKGETEEQNGNLLIDGESLYKIIDMVGSTVFPSGSVLSTAEGSKRIESIVKALQQSVSTRITIRSKERS